MAIAVACNDGGTGTKLEAAILLYKNSSEINFVAVHEIEYINHDKSKPYIGAGRPATKAALSRLVKELLPSIANKRAVLPANLLSYDFEHLAWYVPPSKKQLWFNNEKLGGKQSAKIDLPGLVFYVDNKSWHVFALKTKERPNADTQLFVSPFLNVWSGGKICVGNISVPKLNGPASMEAYEDAFFNSYFTHINIHEKNGLVKYQGGPYNLWKQLIDGELNKFPLKALVPHKLTLGEFLASINGGE